jgi:hypothetical protein
MFNNKKYIGVYEYLNNVSIEDGCPAIIPIQLWDKVQSKLATTKKAPSRGKATTEYFLVGKTFCAECNMPMGGESANKKGVRYYYYACSGKKRLHNCNKKNIRKEELENIVFNAALEALTDENIAWVAVETEKAALQAASEKSYLKQYEKELKDVDKELRNIGNAISKGIITETTKEMLEDAEARRRAIRNKIAYEKIALSTVITKERVSAFLHSYQKGKREDVVFVRKLFDTLVNRIYVSNETITIYFNIKEGEPQTVSLFELETHSPTKNRC